MRCASMSGDMGEHGAAIHDFAVKCRGHVDPVEDMIFWLGNVEYLEQGRIQIGRLDSDLAVRTRPGDSRPNHDSWNTHPSFVDSSFAARRPTEKMSKNSNEKMWIF